MDIESSDEQQARINSDMKIDEIKQLITAEDIKFKSWKAENIRRRHNYVPFIYNLMKVLAEKGKLNELVDKAAKVTQEKIKKKAEAKKKEKERKEKEKEKEKEKSSTPSSNSSASASSTTSSSSSSSASNSSSASSSTSSTTKPSDKK